jgi:hypothetical protein
LTTNGAVANGASAVAIHRTLPAVASLASRTPSLRTIIAVSSRNAGARPSGSAKACRPVLASIAAPAMRSSRTQILPRDSATESCSPPPVHAAEWIQRCAPSSGANA